MLIKKGFCIDTLSEEDMPEYKSSRKEGVLSKRLKPFASPRCWKTSLRKFELPRLTGSAKQKLFGGKVRQAFVADAEELLKDMAWLPERQVAWGKYYLKKIFSVRYSGFWIKHRFKSLDDLMLMFIRNDEKEKISERQ
jgi:hypothetical protein